MRRQSGFTFIEILVVVTIMLLLAAVGVQQLLRARIVTNEQLALSSMRLIGKSCQFFILTTQDFPSALTDLGAPSSDPPYLDDARLLAGQKQGYQFVYTKPSAKTFVLLANPQVHGTTGVRHFSMDQSMTIHATQQNQNATAADPVVP